MWVCAKYLVLWGPTSRPLLGFVCLCGRMMENDLGFSAIFLLFPLWPGSVTLLVVTKPKRTTDVARTRRRREVSRGRGVAGEESACGRGRTRQAARQ